MIDAAIEHIAVRLNQYLSSVFSLDQEVVVISNILEQDGTAVQDVNNKLALFLVNIEKEVAARRLAAARTASDESAVLVPDPVHLNLFLMVAANFRGSTYREGLRYLSETASFFQRHPVFDHHNSPDLDPAIGRLVLDMENLTLQDLGTLWGALSGHYTPSILYKVRTVSYAAEDTRARVPVVRETGSRATP